MSTQQVSREVHKRAQTDFEGRLLALIFVGVFAFFSVVVLTILAAHG